MKKLERLFTVSIILMGVLSMAAVAMYYPNSFYDARAKTWTYEGPVDTSYNCLGYATGSMTFEWPWRGNATTADVNNYLEKYYNLTEYTSGPYAVKIHAYGTTDNVVHFAKSDGRDIIAKWGQLELISSETWDPYYSAPGNETDYYGPLVASYRMNKVFG